MQFRAPLLAFALFVSLAPEARAVQSDSICWTDNADGNVVAWTRAGIAHTAAYDVFNRLSRHTRSGSDTTYAYNALDQRVGVSGTTSRRFTH
jgi:YD repeat-containing protein